MAETNIDITERVKQLLDVSLIRIVEFLAKELVAKDFYEMCICRRTGESVIPEPTPTSRAVVVLETTDITNPEGGTLCLYVDYFSPVNKRSHRFEYARLEPATARTAKKLDAVLNKEINQWPIPNLSYEKHLG